MTEARAAGVGGFRMPSKRRARRGEERLRASPGGGGPRSPSIACRGAGHASRGGLGDDGKKVVPAMSDTPGTVVVKTVFR